VRQSPISKRKEKLTPRREDAKITENEIGKVHAKQVLTYLKLKGLELGYTLNLGANLLKDGIERVVRGLWEENLGVFASLRETKPASEKEGKTHTKTRRRKDH